jgi:chaperonin GroEL
MDERKHLNHGRAGGRRPGRTAFFDVVRDAIGPRGKYLVVPSPDGPPLIAKNGAVLARRFGMAAQHVDYAEACVRESGLRTERLVGDGATTAMLIAIAILERLDAMSCRPAEYSEVAQGLALGLDASCEAVRKNARNCTSAKRIAQVAATAAGGDKEIGKLVARAIRQVGPYGGVTIEAGGRSADTVVLSRGIEFVGGYEQDAVADYLNNVLVFDDAHIAVVTGRLSEPVQLSGVLNAVSLRPGPLIVVAADVSERIRDLFEMNSEQGPLRSFVLRAPYRGKRQRAFLDDLATLTGAQIIAAELQGKAPDGRLARLGRVRQVRIGALRTILIGAKGQKEEIAARIQHLETRGANMQSASERDFLQARTGRLAGGVATIKVGATNGTAQFEKMQRVGHALAAARAAVSNGYVEGGGVALLQVRDAIEGRRGNDEVINAGLDLVLLATQVPAMQIARNAGAEPNSVVRRILEDGGQSGFDAASYTYTNLVRAGILDSADMVCEALRQGIEAVVRVLEQLSRRRLQLASNEGVCSSLPPYPLCPGDGSELHRRAK